MFTHNSPLEREIDEFVRLKGFSCKREEDSNEDGFEYYFNPNRPEYGLKKNYAQAFIALHKNLGLVKHTKVSIIEMLEYIVKIIPIDVQKATTVSARVNNTYFNGNLFDSLTDQLQDFCRREIASKLDSSLLIYAAGNSVERACYFTLFAIGLSLAFQQGILRLETACAMLQTIKKRINESDFRSLIEHKQHLLYQVRSLSFFLEEFATVGIIATPSGMAYHKKIAELSQIHWELNLFESILTN